MCFFLVGNQRGGDQENDVERGGIGNGGDLLGALNLRIRLCKFVNLVYERNELNTLSLVYLNVY